MCIVVCVASPIALSTEPARAGEPLIFVELLGPESATNEHLTLPFRYLVAAHDGCGCGFEEPHFEGEAWDKSAASIDALVDWLSPAIAAGGPQMLVCYAGQESWPVSRVDLSISDVGDFDFGSAVTRSTLLTLGS